MPTAPQKARQRREEPIPLRICANPKCGVEFQPARTNQVFHDTPCRKTYWREAVHDLPHACPLCTVVHDPDEAAVLSALEMLIMVDQDDDRGRAVLQVDRLEAFIARRREILATKPAAPSDV